MCLCPIPHRWHCMIKQPGTGITFCPLGNDTVSDCVDFFDVAGAVFVALASEAVLRPPFLLDMLSAVAR